MSFEPLTKLKENSSYLALYLAILIFFIPIFLGFLLGIFYFFANDMQSGECFEASNSILIGLCYILNIFLEGFISSIFVFLPIGTFFMGVLLLIVGLYLIIAFFSQLILKKRLIDDDLVGNFVTYMILGQAITSGIGLALLAFSVTHYNKFFTRIIEQINVVFN